jgi:hypothetical protein
MKYWLLYFSCMTTFICCRSNNNPDGNALRERDTLARTIIKWEDSVINFGTIETGDSVRLKYRFYNAGKTPLVVYQARPECGCTVTEFPKEAVMPGKSGFIAATFKSGTHAGAVNKTITVTTNTSNRALHILVLRGNVKVRT